MVYNETGASLAELFHLLLDPSAPAIRPAADIRKTADKLEKTVPGAILACVNPSAGQRERAGRGRPKKTQTGAEMADRPVNSFAAFLYNGYNNAKARRAEMAEALRLHPVSVMKEAEEKAADLLYEDGTPCFDRERLLEVLTADGCIPFPDQARREACRKEITYYYLAAPEKAFARVIMALLLQEQAEPCFDLLFPVSDREDDTPESLARTAAALEARGSFKEAREMWRQILRAGGGQAADAAYEIGRMFRYGLGGRKDAESARSSFEEANELSGTGVHPAASFALYSMASEEGQPERALAYLMKSAEAGSADALRELGNFSYRGSGVYGIAQNRQEAMQYYRTAAGEEDPVSQRMLGICLDAEGHTAEAAYWYERAARNGDEDAAYYWMQIGGAGAAETLSRVSDAEDDAKKQPAFAGEHGRFSSGTKRNWCFYNAENEETATFIASLGEGWHVVKLPAGDPLADVPWLQKGAQGGQPSLSDALDDWLRVREAGSRAVFFLFEADTNRNLEDLLRITGRINRAAAENHETDDMRQLPENTRLFVRCGEMDETAAKVVDTCNAAHEFRRENCFKITLCDPAKDASAFLLTRYPLFLPQKNARYRRVSVAVIGGGRVVPQIVCDILSVMPVERDGKPVSITVIDERAEEIRGQLVCAAPALFTDHAPEKLPVDVSFETMSAAAFFDKLERNPEKDAAWERKRYQWNYYIAAGDDDRSNLDIAVRLRETLTRMDLSARPVIAVYLKSNLLSRQAARFSVLGERIGFSWFNQYDLSCFGSAEQLYSAGALLENPWRRRAFELHAAYYGDAGNHLLDAEIDYWSRTYNREASVMSAVSAVYKLYQAGLHNLRGIDFSIPAAERDERAERAWQQWISDPDHEEQAVRNEHIRWNYFVCTRGWRQAGIEQMQAYIGRGNPRQQLYLARLHPCIVDWNRLRYVESEYNKLMRSRNPEWKDRDFVESDRIMVKNCWKRADA